jgi:hypothetical protein
MVSFAPWKTPSYIYIATPWKTNITMMPAMEKEWSNNEHHEKQ